MPLIEVNFDGLVGPTHNYAGLSLGNLAATSNAGQVARPRAAALQGLAKMRRLIALGVRQGMLLPHERPASGWLRAMGFEGTAAEVCAAAHRDDPALLRLASSASAMWTANAATVSPGADTRDGRLHLTVANLSTMAHRAIEPPETLAQLRTIFADGRFVVHGPVPARFGDEGAANHMRLAGAGSGPGVEVFVYGEDSGGRFPVRQDRRASEAVARLHGLDPERTLFVRQSLAAIEAGAFHNDVVAVSNGTVLFAHEQAFEDAAGLYGRLEELVPGFRLVEVPAAEVGLEAAVTSYLFNSQLVGPLPGEADGGMLLLAPAEVREVPAVSAWLDRAVAGNGPIGRVETFDLRESMRNGGGPACLRLRVQMDEEDLAAVDQRFMLSEAKVGRLERLVETWWPAEVAPADLGDPAFREAAWAAGTELRRALGL